MSSIWTPGGERPVGHDPEHEPEPASDESPRRAAARRRLEDAAAGDRAAGEPSDDELAAELAEAQRQLAEAPAALVVANHCIGLFQLAAIHLNRERPAFADAQLAIDALASVVESLGDRLGEHEQPLRDALAQIRLAFVQVRSAKP